jgi:peroxiredoxin
MSDIDILRSADLSGQSIWLLGSLPETGSRLIDVFAIPAARRAVANLTEADLSSGIVIVSTLPNIQRHACLAQIVELEEKAAHLLPGARIVHVSNDAAVHWREVDRYHPDVLAESYSLHGASASSRASFTSALGVGVLGHDRIAHGLFALRDGVFLAASVPFDQMRAPDVGPFLGQIASALRGGSE